MQNLGASMQRFVVVCLMTLGAVAAPSALAAAPSITKLSPATAIAGGKTFPLTIEGTGFTSASKVYWNNTVGLTVKYVNTKELKATVPGSEIGKAGKFSVIVATAGVKSKPAAFTVLPPKPVITALTPDTAIAGGPAIASLTITGNYFVAPLSVKWVAGTKSTALTVSLKSSKEAVATVPAALLINAGKTNVTDEVTVTTASGTATEKFTVEPEIPVITGLSPSSIAGASPAFPLIVSGYNFAAGATAIFNGQTITPSSISAKSLKVTVPAAYILTPGTVSVEVKTAKGESKALPFVIKQPKPTISKLTPATATAGSPGLTLDITGTYFVKGSTTVNWVVGTSKTSLTPSSYTGTTALAVPVTKALLTNPGTATVSVTTTGGTSSTLPFTITAPLPVVTGLSPDSVIAGQTQPFTFDVNGSGFVTGAKVNWNGSTTGVTTVYVSNAQLQATVQPSLIATANTTAEITVTTSAGTSAENNNSVFSITSPSGPACANSGSGNAALSGVYSFQFTGINPSNGQANLNAGTFTADGKGGITAGLSDTNGPYFTSEEQPAFTGTYSVGSDDRGLLTLNYTGGSTAYLCFALNSFSNGVAGGGSLVSDLTNKQSDAGAFYAQGSTSLTLSSVKGSWALGIQGAKAESSSGPALRGASAGYVTLDGQGGVSAGELDTSQDALVSSTLTNTYKSQLSVTGGSYTLDPSGRGTLTLNYSGGGTGNFIFYVAGTNQIYLLSSDAGNNGANAVLAGRALLRTATSFSSASLSGNSVFVEHQASETNSETNSYDHRLVQAGILAWQSGGKYTETYDQNDAGNVTLEKTSSSTYSVDSNGRVTINGTSPAVFAYLVGPNEGFAVSGNPGVSFEYFLNQTATNFGDSGFNGDFSEGSLWYGYEEQRANSGEVASNGEGSLSGNLDVSALVGGVDVEPRAPRLESIRRPAPMVVSVDDTYSASSGGRYIVSSGGNPVEALYLVSPDKAYAIDISGSIWQPLEEFNHQ
jgi:hypothetical protein